MPQPPSETKSHIPDPWRPRFGIGGMLLVMLVFSMMAASGYYLVQALRVGGPFQLGFIVVTLMTPLLLVVVVSACYHLLNRRTRRSRRRDLDD